MNATPETLYCGKRETVIAELGGLTHIYPGKYLLQPDGNAAFDAEGVNSLKDLKAMIAEYRRMYPGIRIAML